MPISSPARTIRFVSATSSPLGVGIAGRMVVEQHERRGAGAGRGAEHLARMDDARVERADRQQRRPQDAVLACRAGRRRTARPAACRTAAPGARRRRARVRICGRSRRGRRRASGGRLRPPRSSCDARARADARHAAQIVGASRGPARAVRRPRRAPRWPARARWSCGTPCPRTIASSSLSPSPPAPTRSSFSRGRSCGATIFIGSSCCISLLLYFCRRARASALIAAHAASSPSCCSPPRAAPSRPRKKSTRRRPPSISRAPPAPSSYAAEEYAAAAAGAPEGARRRRSARLPPGPQLRHRRAPARAGAPSARRPRARSAAQRRGRGALRRRRHAREPARRRACATPKPRASRRRICALRGRRSPRRARPCKKRARRLRAGNYEDGIEIAHRGTRKARRRPSRTSRRFRHGRSPKTRAHLQTRRLTKLVQRPSNRTSAQPVRNRPASVHSTRCAPPGDDDLHVARGAAVGDRRDRRGARAGARRLGRSDAALPDQDPDAIRAPRRARARRSIPAGKIGCTASLAAIACSRSSVTSPRTTHCGLPTRSVTASIGVAVDVDRPPLDLLRLPHRGAKGEPPSRRSASSSSVFTPASVSMSIDSPGRDAAARAPATRPGSARRCPRPRSSCRRR